MGTRALLVDVNFWRPTVNGLPYFMQVDQPRPHYCVSLKCGNKRTTHGLDLDKL